MMDNKKITKVVVLLSGVAFLGSSVAGIGGLIASSLQKPAAKENIASSQDAQLQAQEKGFLGVLKREPNNPTALKGAIEIWRLRIDKGDAKGVKTTIEGLVKSNPNNKIYKELLVAIDKTISETKKVGTLKSTEQKRQPNLSK
jgi:predicted Zn-dependent protease